MYAPEHQDAELINKLRRAGGGNSRIEPRCGQLAIASAAARAFADWMTHFNTAQTAQTCITVSDMLRRELDRQRVKANSLLKELDLPRWSVLFCQNGGPVLGHEVQAENGMLAMQAAMDYARDKGLSFYSVTVSPAKPIPTGIAISLQEGKITGQLMNAADSEGGEI